MYRIGVEKRLPFPIGFFSIKSQGPVPSFEIQAPLPLKPGQGSCIPTVP